MRISVNFVTSRQEKPQNKSHQPLTRMPNTPWTHRAQAPKPGSRREGGKARRSLAGP